MAVKIDTWRASAYQAAARLMQCRAEVIRAGDAQTAAEAELERLGCSTWDLGRIATTNGYRCDGSKCDAVVVLDFFEGEKLATDRVLCKQCKEREAAEQLKQPAAEQPAAPKAPDSAAPIPPDSTEPYPF